MTLRVISEFAESPELLSTLFDIVPTGIVIVDEQRNICAANRVFEDSLGLERGGSIGRCEGVALGCLNAVADHDHHADGLSNGCRTCEARKLALQALEQRTTQRGRAHFQINAGGRLEDVTLTLSAAPFEAGGKVYAIVVIEDVFRLRGLRRPTEGTTFHGMVGGAASMDELYDTIRQVGPLDVPVLIQGESGVGKELVANALHAESRRRDKLLVPVNCGALPDGLLESELFGHVKGAFTGAIREKKGRFQLADGGTIFLDEIGELSQQMQVKFLRVLQNGSFEPVGSERTVAVNTRVICATNRHLESEVDAGRFRADLYYRLCVVPIAVPPLRDRTGDIPALAEHFLRKVSEDTGRTLPGFTDAAIQQLRRHPWPGNIRELENAVRYAAIKARGAPIDERHLPPQIKATEAPKTARPARRKLDQARVDEALETADGNKSEAAKHLGVSRATLYRFLDAKSNDA